MDKYRVSLTDKERTALEQMVSIGKSAARKLTHARILLLADAAAEEDCSDDEIVAALGAGTRTIARVRKRFVTEGFLVALDHKPQPPRPDKIKIKGNIEQKLVQLACSDPPKGRCHWTLQLLADELVVLGLADAISTETIRQSLKKKRHSALDSRDVVHPARGRCGVRLADGRRDPDLPFAIQPGVSGGLFRRSLQATIRRSATAQTNQTWQPCPNGLRVRAQGSLQPTDDV